MGGQDWLSPLLDQISTLIITSRGTTANRIRSRSALFIMVVLVKRKGEERQEHVIIKCCHCYGTFVRIVREDLTDSRSSIGGVWYTDV